MYLLDTYYVPEARDAGDGGGAWPSQCLAQSREQTFPVY